MKTKQKFTCQELEEYANGKKMSGNCWKNIDTLVTVLVQQIIARVYLTSFSWLDSLNVHVRTILTARPIYTIGQSHRFKSTSTDERPSFTAPSLPW